MPFTKQLAPTVRGLINQLLEDMEKEHGEIFVTHALGYLTAAYRGLSDSEMEDILSCDDEVGPQTETKSQHWPRQFPSTALLVTDAAHF